MTFPELTLIGLHLLSAHIPQHTQNNLNPGLYVRTADSYVAGAYYNSLRRPSIYVGKVFSLGPVNLTAGLITGYQYEEGAQYCHPGKHHTKANPCFIGLNKAPVGLLLAPSLEHKGHRLSIVPSIGAGSSTALHYSYEWSFK